MPGVFNPHDPQLTTRWRRSPIPSTLCFVVSAPPARSGEQRGVYSCRLHAGSGTALTGRRLGAQHMLVVSAMGPMPTRRFSITASKGRWKKHYCPELAEIDHCSPVDVTGRSSKQRMNETLFAPLFRLLPGNGNPLMRETWRGSCWQRRCGRA